MITKEEIAMLRELIAKATPGPWEYIESTRCVWAKLPIHMQANESCVVMAEGRERSEGLPQTRNMDFIVAAREWLPKLLDTANTVTRVREVLIAVGCDCSCGHDSEGHNDDCDRCSACRITAEMQSHA